MIKMHILTLAIWSLINCPAFAQVKPGDFITHENASKVANLVSPGVLWKVRYGMTMKIVSTERVDPPPPYHAATEQYAGQVRLSDDRRSLVGYVAGEPFPLIDPNDPEVANKIVWNSVFRPITTDDYDLRYYDCDSSFERHGRQDKQIEYFEIGHYAGYNLVGRTEVDPMPADPDFKSTGRYWLFGLYPILSPQEIRGAGLIRWRYADPKRGDDIWSLASGSRRLRRLNESIMSSSVTSNGSSAHAWDPDHYSGFDAKPEQYFYKFLGEKEMLATMHAIHSPEVQCETDGGTSVCPKPGKCAICTCWKPPPTCREYGLSTRRRSSTWTARPGSNHTSTVTIAMAICSAVISIGSPRAIGQCPMRILQSILSSGRSWSARSRLTSNQVSRQCAICPAEEDSGKRMLVHQYGSSRQELLSVPTQWSVRLRFS